MSGRSDLAFIYGFVLLRADAGSRVVDRPGWNALDVGGFHLSSHPRTSVRMLATAKASVVLVGDAFVCRGRLGLDAILSRLAAVEAWEGIDNLAGRFAIFRIQDGECKVAHDPFGSRTVYYRHSGEFGIASHAALLAEAISEPISKEALAFVAEPEYAARGTRYLPGDATMYASIKALIPNNYYDSALGACIRFWPREALPRSTTGELFAACDEYFDHFSRFLRGRYNAVLGLTGGVDARALIAGLCATQLPMRLVSWTGGRLPSPELEVVEKMVKHLAKPHAFIEPNKEIKTVRFNEIQRAADIATGYCRGNSKLSANMAQGARAGDVFIRGYGGEILRGFYNRHYATLSGDLPADLFNLYKTRRIKSPSSTFARFAQAQIEGFIERAGYMGDFCGLDVRDLYYWEQRMGVWGANMLNEMDPGMYSIVGFNSRPLYEAAMSLSGEERFGSQLMLDITARYDGTFAAIKAMS